MQTKHPNHRFYTMPHKTPEERMLYAKQYHAKQKNNQRYQQIRQNYQFRNKDKKAEYDKQYRQRNRHKIKERQKRWISKQYKDNNQKFKITTSIRGLVHHALRRKNMKKSQRTHDYLGCSLEFFVTKWWPLKIQAWNSKYPSMQLDAKSCCIDHVKPVAAFAENEMHECNHYTNLQPLPKDINKQKSNIWSTTDESHWRSHILNNEQNPQPYLPIGLDIQ